MNNFYIWLEKYIPPRNKRKICRVGGIGKDVINRWLRLDNYPSTLSIIYLSLAVAKEYHYQYEAVVLEGIYAISKDRGVQKIEELPKNPLVLYANNQDKDSKSSINSFYVFYNKYMTTEMREDVVIKGILTYQQAMSYRRKYLNITPRPDNLVELCKYISMKNDIEVDLLMLEALDMILE